MQPVFKVGSIRYGILLIMGFFTLQSARAQGFSMDTADLLVKDPPLQIFKTSPMAMLFSQIPGTAETRMMYEQVHSPKRSSVIALSYVYISPLLEEFIAQQLNGLPFELKINGFRIQGATKHYIINEFLAPYGIYIGLHASYNSLKAYIPKSSPYRRTLNNAFEKTIFLNTNVIGGLQIVFFKKFAIDAYAGLGYRNNFITIHEQGISYTGVRKYQIDMQEVFPGIGNNLKLSFSINMGLAF